jgi:hypothetical protein
VRMIKIKDIMNKGKIIMNKGKVIMNYEMCEWLKERP